MKPVIILAFAFSISAGNTQTPLIAHKSHAGSSNSYLITSTSNFGDNPNLRRSWQEPLVLPELTETFIPLNDSVIILEITDIEQKVIKVDTLKNQKKYSPMLFEYTYRDSIQKQEYREKEYQLKIEEEAAAAEKKRQMESQQQINQNTAPPQKKKKSYLLFLFGITGGGMLMMKLFSRSKNTNPSIAST